MTTAIIILLFCIVMMNNPLLGFALLGIAVACLVVYAIGVLLIAILPFLLGAVFFAAVIILVFQQIQPRPKKRRW